MSQKKVDYYKSQKANREKQRRKEKLSYVFETGIFVLLAVLVVVWIGVSVYDKATAKDDSASVVTETVIDTTALDEYTNALNAE